MKRSSNTRQHCVHIGPPRWANFGLYCGVPSRAEGDIVDVAYHNADGSVRHVVVGGAPKTRVKLPDGVEVDLDHHGRIAFTPDQARGHELPTTHTDPPEHIVRRRRFAKNPEPAGNEITLIVDGRAVPLKPGNRYRRKIVERHDALSFARLPTANGDVVLPLADLGAELPDRKRVNRLLRVGIEATIGDRNAFAVWTIDRSRKTWGPCLGLGESREMCRLEALN